MNKLYRCRCSYIINEKEKEFLKGKGQLPDVDCCFGCDSSFQGTRKLIDRIRYLFFKNWRL